MKNHFIKSTHRIFDSSTGVLRLSLQVNLWSVLNDPLDRHLNKLIEGVELLSDKSLLIKV